MSRKRDEMAECKSILGHLKSRRDAGAFLEPVDWKAYDLPDYPQIVKHPMDLGTITTKLKQGKYTTADQFAADVRLVWGNAKLYNRQDSAIWQQADSLSKIFEKKFLKLRPQSASRKRKRSQAKAEPREATRNDRLKFTQGIGSLQSEELGQLVSMIQKRCPNSLQEEGDDQLSIEVNAIDSATLLALNAFLEECGKRSKKRRRTT